MERSVSVEIGPHVAMSFYNKAFWVPGNNTHW